MDTSENLQPAPQEQEKKSYPRLEAWDMMPHRAHYVYSAGEVKKNKVIERTDDYEKLIAKDYYKAKTATVGVKAAQSTDYIVSMDREGRYFYWCLDEALKNKGIEKPAFALNEKCGDSAEDFLFKHLLEKNSEIKRFLQELYDSTRSTDKASRRARDSFRNIPGESPDNNIYRFLSEQGSFSFSQEQLMQAESLISGGRENIDRFSVFKDHPRDPDKKQLILNKLLNLLSFSELQEKGLLTESAEAISDEELSELSYSHLVGPELRKAFADSEILKAGEESLNRNGSFSILLVDGSRCSGRTLRRTTNIYKALFGDRLSISWLIPFGESKAIGENSLDYGNFWSKIVTMDGIKEFGMINSIISLLSKPVVSAEEHERIVRKMLR